VRASSGIIQGSTLFRGNDIASHLLSAYCQSVGRNFLVEVMRPLVEQVLALYAQNKSMEVVLSLSLSCLIAKLDRLLPSVDTGLSLSLSLTHTHTLQIDPTRAAPGEDVEENVQTLYDYCQLFLDTVTSSIKCYPM
jgi:hypothetical protein